MYTISILSHSLKIFPYIGTVGNKPVEKILTTLEPIKDQPEKLLEMRDSGWDFRSYMSNVKMENLSLSRVDERTLELQWSNSQMDQDKHCIGGYVIKLKSKNSAESNSSFYEHHDSTVSYFAVSGGGDCHGESNIFEW